MHEALNSKNLGNELIFLISQPRSGSTLLQHILGSHEVILTLPEPWHMLHTVYARRLEGLSAEYNAQYANIALQDFLKRINQGQSIYDDAIRDFALRIYRGALAGSDKSIFLDKTPRYFFIIDELAHLFPNAKFIFLLRNPLSVFASILATNFNGDWLQMVRQEDRRKDLLTAPNSIMNGIKKVGQTAFIVKYEELVSDTDTVISDLCTYLGVKYDKQMLEYGDKTRFEETSFVDSKSIYEHRRAVPQYTDAWKLTLDTKMKIALARAYVNLLDDEVLRTFGENRGELNSELIEHERSIQKGRPFSNQKLLERLLQHGDSFQSRGQRIKFEIGIRMRDESILSKVQWLAAKIIKGR